MTEPVYEGELVRRGDTTLTPRTYATQAEIDRTVNFPETALARIRGALSEYTWKQYRYQWARYLRWCEATHRTPLPATLETIISYLESMARDNDGLGLSASMVRQALAALRRFHSYGDPPPEYPGGNQAVSDWVTGYEKERARDPEKRPKHADGARAAIVKALLDATPTDKPRGMRDRAILLLGYYLAARRQELANLTFADVRVTVDGLEVLIAYSKTDPTGEDAVWVAVPENPQHPEYCPVNNLLLWMDLCREKGYESGALFRRCDKHDNIRPASEPMSGTAFETVMNRAVSGALKAAKKRRDKAGRVLVQLLQGRLTPHSLRRGFATDARLAGWDLIDIARHGRWSPTSRVVHIYIEEVDKWLRHQTKPVLIAA